MPAVCRAKAKSGYTHTPLHEHKHFHALSLASVSRNLPSPPRVAIRLGKKALELMEVIFSSLIVTWGILGAWGMLQSDEEDSWAASELVGLRFPITEIACFCQEIK